MSEFDKYAYDYSTMLDSSMTMFGGFNKYYTQRKISIVKNSLGNKHIKSVLDFGCGLGSSTSMLQETFTTARVVGADISIRSVEMAREQFPSSEFQCLSDEEFISSCAGAYDVIYVANVFHHVPIDDQVHVMKSLKNMLAPRGEVFFFEHNPFNPLTRWVVSRCEFDKDAVLLTTRQAKNLLAISNLEIKTTSYLLFFPYQLKMFARLEPFMNWLPLGAQYCINASLQTEFQ